MQTVFLVMDSDFGKVIYNICSQFSYSCAKQLQYSKLAMAIAT